MCNATDTIDDIFLYLVLPQSNDAPAQEHKFFVDLPVTLSVPGNFGLPKFDVCFRLRSMDRAAVPKTTIDEDRDLCVRKHQVGRPR